MRLSTKLPLAVIAAALFGCSKPDPLYCDPDTPCDDPERPYCDLEGEFPASDGIGRTCIAQPDFAVSLARPEYQVRIGDELAVEVDVDRIDDFPSDIVVEATGLPAGATADPLTIPGDAASGTLTIHGGDADPGAVAMVTIAATASPAAGPIHHSADLHLLVLGPPGSLDPTFGSNGFAGEPADSTMDDALALMELPDGSLVVAGPTTSAPYNAVLVRYTADGALDTSFGSGGWIEVSLEGAGVTNNSTMQFASQSDGKIIIAAGTESGDIALARVTPDGRPDSSFAGGGIGAVQISSGLVITVDVVSVAADDAIFIAMATGSSRQQAAVVRFTRDGEKDLTFAGGRRDLDRGTNHQPILVRPFADGSVVIGGTAYETDPPAIPFLVRLTPTGALDPSFGDAGQVTLESGFRAAIIDDDGGALLAQSTSGQVTFRRMTSSGDPDSGFGDGGEQVIAIPGAWSGLMTSFIPGPPGVIAVGSPDITIFRLNDQLSSLDPAFGDGGVSATPLEGIHAKKSLRQQDGRVVVLADEDVLPFVLARYFE